MIMGDFRITIAGTGNHGCDRTAKAGDNLDPELCDDPGCVDCRTSHFVSKVLGSQVQSATLEHWPSQSPAGPVDDILNGTRLKGQF